MRIAPVTPLHACVTYDIDKKAYGMVNVTADGLEVLREHEGLEAGWGGTAVGSKYYYNTCAEVQGGFVNSVETYLWDTSTWTCIGYNQDPSLDVLSYSITCDPVTETVWGCFFSADLQSIEIGTLDPMTMKRTGTVGKTTTPLYAMGFSSDGTLYGIDANGTLYTVSLTDGHYTKVAETGIKTDYNTTGTIDTFTDVFYYAACPAGPSDNPSRDWALYSIDLRDNYKVEKCWNLRAELGGMYVANAAAKPAAPAAPELGDVSFTDGSLSGSVSFTAPSVAFDNSPISGALKYGIIANDKVIASGTTSCGTSETVSITLPQAGMYALRVYVSNDAGNSPKSESVTRWFGNGKPLQPADLTAEYAYGDEQITVKWTPVTAAVNDGYIDTSKVTYTVTRSINGSEPVVIADKISDTQVTDAITEADNCLIYNYNVTAYHSEQTSDAASTGYLAVGAIVPPFTPDFTSELSQGYFTTKDYLGKGHKWNYSAYDEALQMIWNTGFGQSDMDAALMTAPVKMEAGKAYEISYNVWMESATTCGVGLQWGTDASNLTTVIDPISVSMQNSSYSEPLHQSVIVHPEADGTYIVSIRALAQKAQSVKMFVNGVTISEGLSNKAPGAVTDVTLTPPYDGSKKLDISMKAPVVTIAGKSLSSLSKIEVKRDGQLVQTFRNPTFGETLSFTDYGTENADVTYIITAFNTEGAGQSWYGNSHMGVNIPASPIDCKIEQLMETPGKVKITWTPVAKDINGNEFDPQLLRYAIFASDYETMIANNIPASDPQAIFRAIAADSGQTFVWYCVVPYTEGGVNGYVGGFGTTPIIPVGTPYDMPYLESFTGSQLHYPMAQSGSQVRISSAISSQKLTIGSQDNDNGLIAWYASPGAYVDLYSANINVEDTDDVAMSFYYAGVPDIEGYLIEPYVVCDGAKELLCAPIDTRDCAESGWNRVQASLTRWSGQTVQFLFHVTCNDNSFGFGLDNIMLKRYAANDLRAGTVSGPSSLKMGKKHDIIAEVKNDGSDDAPAGYSVDLYADDKLVQTVEGPAVRAFATEAVTFTHTPDPFAEEEQTFKTVIRWDDDEVLANNSSDTTTIPLVESTYPGVTDLTATTAADNLSARLTWTEPDHEPKLIELTESFEKYDPFTIAGFGDWSVKDVDGLETWYIGGSVYVPGVGNAPSYPNAEVPKAWMVIDQSQMKLYYDGARTGNCAAMATSSKDVADDWMISPELPGIAQTVKFYAATAPEDCGAESFEFYYSTGGTEPEDFIQMGEAVEVPEGEWVEDEYGDESQVTTWYEYSYDLPEGAKYFAIRYVSDNIYAMFVDDVTFTISDEVLTLQGYNLFRNAQRVNTEPLTVTSHDIDFTTLEPGTYTYAVETIYDKGNSGLSNLVTVEVPETDGVNGITDDKATVSAANGCIIISGVTENTVTVFDTAGVALFNSVVNGTMRVAVAPGIYMVKVGATTTKIVVP